jgi:hypothetical protein
MELARVARRPLKRFTTPEELAGCVSFLLSPAARSMTDAQSTSTAATCSGDVRVVSPSACGSFA